MKYKSQITDKGESVVHTALTSRNTTGNHWSSPEILRQNSSWLAHGTKECEMNNEEIDGHTDFQLSEQLKMCLKTVMLSSLASPGRWEWGMWLMYTRHSSAWPGNESRRRQGGGRWRRRSSLFPLRITTLRGYPELGLVMGGIVLKSCLGWIPRRQI